MSTQKRGSITCHVLDSSRGIPGKNIEVLLEYQETGNGRCSDLVPSDHQISLANYSDEDLKAIYRLTFFTTPYFKSYGQESFYPFVQVVFQIKDLTQHYHVPLLIAPFSYTTYRGS
ncbi:6158_t:CDS:2 [Scutellospora calospora]|uniref:6158_t:CDS:1 n=1 Tax=Scutellospora calospora TaxID=85575 RepID=A0ACA9K9Z1_9GLOM|nr:6158_t:CDS:2 [Scutellospora calospora]